MGPSAKHREQHTIIVSSKCGKLGTLQHSEIIAPSAFLLPAMGFNVNYFVRLSLRPDLLKTIKK
jgi:hypothetical protein